MKKFERINTIMRYINNRGQFTIREISETFEISRATAIRDIQEIEAMGLPLVSQVGREGGYSVMQNQLLPAIQFNEDEVKALIFAFIASKNQQLPYLTGRKSLTEKLFSLISDQQKDQLYKLNEAIIFSSTNPYNTDMLDLTDQANPILEEIFLCYLAGDEMRCILYDQRVLNIRMLKFYHRQTSWVIECFDLDQKTIHFIELAQIYRVENYQSIEQKTSYQQEMAAIQRAKSSTNIVLKVEKFAIRQFKKYHPVYFTLAYTDPFQMTGIIKGHLPLNDSPVDISEIVSWILFLGQDIEIIQIPEELRQTLNIRLSAIK